MTTTKEIENAINHVKDMIDLYQFNKIEIMSLNELISASEALIKSS